MKLVREVFEIETKGEGDIIDLTDRLRDLVRKSGVKEGLINIFSIGSTCAISNIEYEPGLKRDVFKILDRIAPSNIHYNHNERWGDYNGHSHVRATLIKPIYTAPIEDGDILLGTWQQIVFIELDVKPRRRRIVVTIIGT